MRRNRISFDEEHYLSLPRICMKDYNFQINNPANDEEGQNIENP